MIKVNVNFTMLPQTFTGAIFLPSFEYFMFHAVIQVGYNRGHNKHKAKRNKTKQR